MEESPKNEDNKKQMSLMRECYESLAKRLEYSTIIGFSGIVMTDLKIVKAMWYLAVLVGLALTLYLIVINVQNYLQFSVVNQVEIVREFPMPFPTVTICNLNYFTTEHAKDYIINVTGINLFDPVVFEENYISLNSFLSEAKISVVQNNISDEEKQLLSYSIAETIAECSFGNKYCDFLNFKWVFLPKYGNCFQFNPLGGVPDQNSPNSKEKPRTAIDTGSENGLSLELFVGVPSILDVVTKASGAIVFITPINGSLVSASGVTLSPNTETNIVISREEKHKLSAPYSQCDILQSSNSSLYDLVKSKGYDYTQSDCLVQCYLKTMIEKCGCYDAMKISYFDHAKPCSHFLKLECVDSSLIGLSVWNSEYIDEFCYPLCPLECASTEYKTSISINQFPTTTYADFLAKRGLVSDIVYSAEKFSQPLEKLILKVNIYFDSLTYTSITEVASIDQITFISNIGGLLGLFLGATVLSFLELVEFVIIIFQIIKSRMSKVKSHQESNLINVRPAVENSTTKKG
jgi:hypothetical protein